MPRLYIATLLFTVIAALSVSALWIRSEASGSGASIRSVKI